MKCPHCLVEMHPASEDFYLSRKADSQKLFWLCQRVDCPACGQPSFFLAARRLLDGPFVELSLVYPRRGARTSPAPEVPAEYARDYSEASLILQDSPRASAALSRRCLQHLLREEAKVKHGDLAREIQEVLDSGKLPSHLAEALDAIRHIGNFAAHPIKSESTGDIVDVEPDEAEWTLDVLEGLFDFYFVQPARTKEKRDKLNEKLKAAGKPEMKQPTK